MEKEIWKIVNFNSNYEVSNLGKLRNTKTKNVLKLRDNGHGYLVAHLYNKGKRKVEYIHRLVAYCFIPNIDNKEEVNHKDGDKSNNCVKNLEWVTKSENIKHSYKIGLREITEKQRQNAILQLSKITPEALLRGKLKSAETNKKKSTLEYMKNSLNQAKPIKCIELNKIFLCPFRVEQKLGIKKSAIQKAMNKKYKTCGGYHWIYIKNNHLSKT